MEKNRNKTSCKELVIGNKRDLEKYGNVYGLVDDIIMQGNTFIISDPRREKLRYYYEELVQKGYTIYNIDISDYFNSDCWNPLDMPYSLFQSGQVDKAKDYLVSMADEIFMTAENLRDDDFWRASSANLFVGLAYALFNVVENPAMLNFSSIYQMAEDGLQSFSHQKNFLKYFFEEIYDKDSYARANVSLVINAPSETRGGILTTFFQKMRALIMSDNISNIINQSGIDLANLSNDRMAFFLNYNPEQSSDQSRLINLFLRQSYLYACDNDLPIHFIFNDFLELKYVPYIENMFLSQSKPNIYVFLDSMSLFDKVYKNFSCDFFLTQADQVIYLNKRDFFIYAPDYLKEKIVHTDRNLEKESMAIVCKNDKNLTMISMSEYKKKNNEFSFLRHNPPKPIWEKYDIKTKVIEHQRQKLLLGREINEKNNESMLEQSDINRNFSEDLERSTKSIDLNKMMQDIDNKIQELEEEERLEKEFQKAKIYEETMRWRKIKKYITWLIVAISVINILFSIFIKIL